MSLNHSYTAELEYLIINTLLPVYANYNKRMGIADRYAGIPPELIKQIKAQRKLPALLMPKEKRN